MILLTLATLMAAPIAADIVQAPAPSQSTSATSKKSDPNKVVCRNVEVTGSRLQRTRECHTLLEWAGLNASARQDLERQQINRGKSY